MDDFIAFARRWADVMGVYCQLSTAAEMQVGQLLEDELHEWLVGALSPTVLNILGSDAELFADFAVIQLAWRHDPWGVGWLPIADVASDPSLLEAVAACGDFDVDLFRLLCTEFGEAVGWSEPGFVPPDRFACMVGWRWTTAFVHRVYDRGLPMNFWEWCRFWVAWRILESSAAAQAQWFEWLDIDGDGVIGPIDIAFWVDGQPRPGPSRDSALAEVLDQLCEGHLSDFGAQPRKFALILAREWSSDEDDEAGALDERLDALLEGEDSHSPSQVRSA
jgi:hypothetical protein